MAMLVLGLLLIWNLIPFLALIGLGFLIASKREQKLPVGVRREVLAGLWISAVSTFIGICFMLYSIVTVGDAQGALGLLFAPLVTWPLAILTFGLGWAVSVLRRFSRDGKTLGAFMLLGMTVIVAGGLWYRLTPYRQAESTTMSGNELRTLYVRGLARHDINMLMRLAGNPQCPPDILRQLVHSPSPLARAVMNPSLPADVIKELSSRGDSRVRGWLTNNPSTSKEILAQLANDHDDVVRSGATARLHGGVPLPQKPLGTLNHWLDLLFD